MDHVSGHFFADQPEEYFFFPSLINLEEPVRIWGSNSHTYYTGWCLQCADVSLPEIYIYTYITFNPACFINRDSRNFLLA